MSCMICKESLRGPPYTIDNFPLGAITTRCGHLFHQFCIGQFWDSLPYDNFLANQRTLICGYCSQVLPENSNVEVFVNLEPKMEELISAMEKLKIEKASAEEKLKVLESPPVPQENLSQPRALGLGEYLEYFDAKCFNCESTKHKALDCTQPPILRVLNATKKSTSGPTMFTSVSRIEGDVAKDVLFGFMEAINYHGTLSREAIQMIYSFHYFGQSCWNCCSPEHGKEGCSFKFVYEGPRDELNRIRKLVYQKFGY